VGTHGSVESEGVRCIKGYGVRCVKDSSVVVLTTTDAQIVRPYKGLHVNEGYSSRASRQRFPL
ncbi:hypothetical protein, partial [uncultured Porphyromonas sp.]|uniref:hypothetical protein n=1 Tax=uncultured Porphyromonas sp. TaxID=159274 RepID=UPI0026358E5B